MTGTGLVWRCERIVSGGTSQLWLNRDFITISYWSIVSRTSCHCTTMHLTVQRLSSSSTLGWGIRKMWSYLRPDILLTKNVTFCAKKNKKINQKEKNAIYYEILQKTANFLGRCPFWQSASLCVCVSLWSSLWNGKGNCLQIFRVTPGHPWDGFKHQKFGGCC